MTNLYNPKLQAKNYSCSSRNHTERPDSNVDWLYIRKHNYIRPIMLSYCSVVFLFIILIHVSDLETLWVEHHYNKPRKLLL